MNYKELKQLISLKHEGDTGISKENGLIIRQIFCTILYAWLIILKIEMHI